MSRPQFLTDVSRISGTFITGDLFDLDQDIAFRDSKRRWWRARKNLVSDGGSIPRPLWFWLGHPFEFDMLPGVLIHDQAYKDQFRSRADADMALREALIANGVRSSKAIILWAGVRLGGWVAWRKHEQAE